MIDHQRDQIVMECDACSEVAESEKKETWKDFWPRMKQDGWRSRQIGKGTASAMWVHACPNCTI
jgi:hypothetical protein